MSAKPSPLKVAPGAYILATVSFFWLLMYLSRGWTMPLVLQCMLVFLFAFAWTAMSWTAFLLWQNSAVRAARSAAAAEASARPDA